ncbi:MAG: hypothetical protein CVU56_04195 [Deltaproteobacteria bacterium HGW-Deltaproteobacteria-14]|jgi:hypothetical protein|nr:MAG: hypothetical protein CVU56_04195 [Deltaproteobacteria bacterium HGW-Deltaproteobacteria-14]
MRASTTLFALLPGRPNRSSLRGALTTLIRPLRGLGRRPGPPRARPWICALALLVSAGCGGGDPLAQLLDHQEAVVGILERDGADPAAAAAAATAYVDAHRAELDQLGVKARALTRELADDPRAVADLALEQQERLRSVGERTLALRKNMALMAEPGISEALDAVLGR